MCAVWIQVVRELRFHRFSVDRARVLCEHTRAPTYSDRPRTKPVVLPFCWFILRDARFFFLLFVFVGKKALVRDFIEPGRHRTATMVFFGKNKSDRRELLASMDQISLHKFHDNGTVYF